MTLVRSLPHRFAIRNLRPVRIGRIRATFDLVTDGVIVKGCNVVADVHGRLAFVSAPRSMVTSDGRYHSYVHFQRALATELFATVRGRLAVKKPP
jgi:hypothetical protein